MADEPTAGANPESREPFVPPGDRPAVQINLDMPLGEMRVRDLTAILGLMAGKNPNFEVGKTSLKDFFDKPFPEVAKDFVKELKIEKIEKPEKPEKVEKNEKLEKPEKVEKIEKNEKFEKPEKSEIKEAKSEKIETGEQVLDPRNIVGPDPRMEQVIQAVSGLTNQVQQLVNQVEELRRRTQG
jgi:hypothetical protein